MKKKYFILIILITITKLYSQDEISIDLVEWRNTRRLALTFENFTTYSDYKFKLDGDDFNCLFIDYESLIDEIAEGTRILNEEKKMFFLNSRIEFNYNNKKIILFFDIDGNYFFNENMYQKNCCLYYSLFKYFSDILIPNKILKDCEEINKSSRF